MRAPQLKAMFAKLAGKARWKFPRATMAVRRTKHVLKTAKKNADIYVGKANVDLEKKVVQNRRAAPFIRIIRSDYDPEKVKIINIHKQGSEPYSFEDVHYKTVLSAKPFKATKTQRVVRTAYRQARVHPVRTFGALGAASGYAAYKTTKTGKKIQRDIKNQRNAFIRRNESKINERAKMLVKTKYV